MAALATLASRSVATLGAPGAHTCCGRNVGLGAMVRVMCREPNVHRDVVRVALAHDGHGPRQAQLDGRTAGLDCEARRRDVRDV